MTYPCFRFGKTFARILCVLAFAGGWRCAAAETAAGPAVWHVSVGDGSDTADGRSRETALASIQRAADAAAPGDTVLVHPGVYHENVIIKRGGTREKPLRIMSDRVEKDRVVLTGAVRAIREGKAKWARDESTPGLYWTAFAYRPARVLASRADLFPYPSLANLKAFHFTEDDYPGTQSGFAWDQEAARLYVRLRADGSQGPADPNEAPMAVSPPSAGGSYGNVITRDDSWNLAVKIEGSAHVVIDGLTFETPGMTGVYSESNDVLVRNCWFYGCRYGVTGREPARGLAAVDRITVEQCHYTQYPAFSDAEDVLRRFAGKKSSNPAVAKYPQHWQRKAGLLPVSGGPGREYNYETGLVRRMGTDWVIRRNHVFESFEALSSGSVAVSVGAEIYENRFERICDNGVETEEHARNIRIHDNFFIDVFESFSWQPRAGAPLPGPVYIYNNVVWQTPAVAALWISAGSGGGVFKLGASDRNWAGGRMGDLPNTVSAAPGGFWVVNNTVVMPAGRLFTLLNSAERRYEGFYFYKNIFCVRGVAPAKKPLTPDVGLILDGNTVAPVDATAAGDASFTEQSAVLAGQQGCIFTDGQFTRTSGVAESGVAEPPAFTLVGPEGAGHPVATLSGVPEAIPPSGDVGALVRPFPVGPQSR